MVDRNFLRAMRAVRRERHQHWQAQREPTAAEAAEARAVAAVRAVLGDALTRYRSDAGAGGLVTEQNWAYALSAACDAAGERGDVRAFLAGRPPPDLAKSDRRLVRRAVLDFTGQSGAPAPRS